MTAWSGDHSAQVEASGPSEVDATVGSGVEAVGNAEITSVDADFSGVDRIVDADFSGVDRIVDADSSGVDRIVDADSSGVDRIVDAWHRERPDLDASPLHVLSRVSRLGEVLAQRRKEVFSAHVLRPYEFDVLAALRRAGEPYERTPGQLLAETHVTSGTMTNRLDVLVERRLVSRRPDPQDRRVTRVRLTTAGRDRVDAALTDLLAVEAELLRGLEPAECDRLARALQRMLDVADRT